MSDCGKYPYEGPIINNGGPAFAFASGDLVSLGMTLRDYFAAAALQGWLATNAKVNDEPLNDSEEHLKIVADVCYRFADSMLAQRAKGGSA